MVFRARTELLNLLASRGRACDAGKGTLGSGRLTRRLSYTTPAANSTGDNDRTGGGFVQADFRPLRKAPASLSPETYDPPGTVELEAGPHSLEMHNLNFRYMPEGDLVLHNINLTIGTGEAVALVGMSGGGKSTF